VADEQGSRSRPLNTRPRDGLGRPLPYGSTGVAGPPEGVRRTPAEALSGAQRLLDEGMPFHAHEVLEDSWRAAPGTERELWRGLAQLAVGCTHAARGNEVGALSLLRRGAVAIAPYRTQSPHGLDIEAVLSWTDSALARVADGTPAVLPSPPLLVTEPD
jgi:uncharacterized protein